MQILLRVAALLGVLMAPVDNAGAQTPGSTILDLYPKGSITQLPVPEIRDDPANIGEIFVRNVSIPTLEIFQPERNAANGVAVIIAPGGGFAALAYESEGTAVAKRLVRDGITAFVLKYRLIETPVDPAGMMERHMKNMGGVFARAKSGDPTELPRFPGEDLAAQDAAQAVRMVRNSAKQWNVDPRRIGFVGFSAGAFLAADVAIGQPSTRPDFVGLIYGGLRTPVPVDAPPAFIATAADDPMLPNDPILLYNAWKTAGGSAELHIYERGGHGFGMKPLGASSDRWCDEMLWWMQSRGILKTAAPPSPT